MYFFKNLIAVAWIRHWMNDYLILQYLLINLLMGCKHLQTMLVAL